MDWKAQFNKDVNPLEFIYRFDTIPIEIPAGFFVNIDMLIYFEQKRN